MLSQRNEAETFHWLMGFAIGFFVLLLGGIWLVLFDQTWGKYFDAKTIYVLAWIAVITCLSLAYLTSYFALRTVKVEPEKLRVAQADTLWRHAQILMESEGSLSYWLKTTVATVEKPSHAKLRDLLQEQIKIITDAIEAQRAAGRDGDAERLEERLLKLATYSLKNSPPGKLEKGTRVLQELLNPMNLKLEK